MKGVQSKYVTHTIKTVIFLLIGEYCRFVHRWVFIILCMRVDFFSQNVSFIIDYCVVIAPLASVNASVNCMMDSVYCLASAPLVTHGASDKWNHSRLACESIQ